MTKLVFLVFYSGCVLLIAPISIWMFFNSPTWIGKGLSVVALSILLLPILIARWYQQKENQKIWGRSIVVIALVVVGFFAVVLLAAPSGVSEPNSPVQHRFFRTAGLGRYSLANIIPESEQVNLGFLLMPYLDPILSTAQANRVSTFTMDLYREMEQDDNFHELGSMMGLAYAELLGLPFDAGHYYLYVPQNDGKTPLPALVFLHGSAGNFKTYTWVWSKFAEAAGFVIIAPSYGFGNWDQGGTVAVVQAVEDAKQVVDIDENQIYLAGLSNGGLGVSQLAAEFPEMFRGLIFISPVMSANIVDGESFQTKWDNRPILVISGETDQRVSVDYVEQRISGLKTGGVNVTSVIYLNEDHFLFFSQPDKIMDDVARWLEENGQ